MIVISARRRIFFPPPPSFVFNIALKLAPALLYFPDPNKKYIAFARSEILLYRGKVFKILS